MIHTVNLIVSLAHFIVREYQEGNVVAVYDDNADAPEWFYDPD